MAVVTDDYLKDFEEMASGEPFLLLGVEVGTMYNSESPRTTYNIVDSGNFWKFEVVIDNATPKVTEEEIKEAGMNRYVATFRNIRLRYYYYDNKHCVSVKADDVIFTES